MWFDSDKEAIEAALGMIGLTAPQDSRIVRIKNTLHLTEMDVSEPLRAEVAKNNRLSPVTAAAQFPFDIDGNLSPF
jgi:hypothetical protein